MRFSLFALVSFLISLSSATIPLVPCTAVYEDVEATTIATVTYSGSTDEDQDASCCDACRANAECELWTRSTTSNDCWLKKGFEKPLADSTKRSNLKSCHDNGQARCSRVVSPMEFVGDKDYFWVPDNTAGDVSQATATYKFTCAGANFLTIKAYAYTPTDDANSVFIDIDNGKPYNWHMKTSSEFKWMGIPWWFSVGAGDHELHVKCNEDGTMIGDFDLMGDNCKFTGFDETTTPEPVTPSGGSGGIAGGVMGNGHGVVATPPPSDATTEPTTTTTQDPTEATEEPTTTTTQDPTEATEEPTTAVEDWTVEFDVTGDGCDFDLHCVWSKNWPYKYDANQECTVTFQEDTHLHFSNHFQVKNAGDELSVAGTVVTKHTEAAAASEGTTFLAGDTLTWSTAKKGGFGFYVCLEDPLKPELPMISNFHYETIVKKPRGTNGKFGSALCMDHDSLVVGSPRSKGPNKEGNYGAVFLFERDGSEWNFQTMIQPDGLAAKDEFGYSVSSHGEWMAIGLRNRNQRKGSVHVYKKDSSGEWVFYSKLDHSSLAKGETFGLSVSIDFPWVAVGANTNGAARKIGSIRLFKFIDGVWTYQSMFQPTAEQGGENYAFGSSVSMHHEWMFVGALAKNTPGFVHIYKLVDDAWTFVEKIVELEVATNKNFGGSVSIDADEGIAIVGASGVDSARGAAYFYELVDGHWQYQTSAVTGHWKHKMKEVEEATQERDLYGSAVTISHGHMAVGASRSDTVYEYSLSDQEGAHLDTAPIEEEDADYVGPEDDEDLEEFVQPQNSMFSSTEVVGYGLSAVAVAALLYTAISAARSAFDKWRYVPLQNTEPVYGSTTL